MPGIPADDSFASKKEKHFLSGYQGYSQNISKLSYVKDPTSLIRGPSIYSLEYCSYMEWRPKNGD